MRVWEGTEWNVISTEKRLKTRDKEKPCDETWTSRSGSSGVCWALRRFGKDYLLPNPRARVLPPSPQTPASPCARLSSPCSSIPQPMFPGSLAGSSRQEDVHVQSRKPAYIPVNWTPSRGFCPPFCPSSPGVFPWTTPFWNSKCFTCGFHHDTCRKNPNVPVRRLCRWVSYLPQTIVELCVYLFLKYITHFWQVVLLSFILILMFQDWFNIRYYCIIHYITSYI